MSAITVANFNIMSSLASKYYFTEENITMNGVPTTLNEIHATVENQRIGMIGSYLKNFIRINPIEVLSLEEVNGEWLYYFSRLLPNYNFVYAEIKRPSTSTFNLKYNSEKFSDNIVTYVRKDISFTNVTDAFQGFYSSKGNISGRGFKYPSRAQVLKLNITGKSIIYAHIHPGGNPDSDGKEFFNILSKFISKMSTWKVLVIGDYNRDKESGAMEDLEKIKLEYYNDDRTTSYHGIIMKIGPDRRKYYYYKNGEKIGLSDERFFKKLDNLYHRGVAVKQLVVFPQGGIRAQQPYTLSNVNGYYNNLGEYVIKSGDFAVNTSWYSDHSMMVYKLLV